MDVTRMTRLAHWKLYTLAENYPEYMDRYSITMERLKMAIHVFVLPGYVCGLMFSLEFHEILWYIKHVFLLFLHASLKRFLIVDPVGDLIQIQFFILTLVLSGFFSF